MKENGIDFYSKTTLKSYNLDETIRYQLSMLDSLDVFTRQHSENVANIACRLCERLKLGKDFTVYCTTCAYLHDIGKLFIPSAILLVHIYMILVNFLFLQQFCKSLGH